MTHANTTARFRLRTAVGLLCALCALSGADAPRSESEAFELARQRIVKMPVDKRDQLRKSFEAFRKLPVERQEQIKQLHADVQADASLKDVMDKYYEWVVTTLDAGQQDELRKESKISKKVSLVKEYRKQQASERSTHDWAEMGGPRDPRWMPKLDDGQLVEVIEFLEKLLFENLKSEEKSKLATLTGPQRHSQILAYAVDREIEQDRRNGRPMPLKLPPFLIENLSKAMGGRLGQPRRPAEFLEKPWMLKMVLWHSVAKSLDDQLKSLPPSPSDLEKRFAELKPTERDEIMQLRPDEGQRKLDELYRDTHPELYPVNSARRYSDFLWREFQPLTPRVNQPPAGGPRPDGGPNRPEPGLRGDGGFRQQRPPFPLPRNEKKPQDGGQ